MGFLLVVLLPHSLKAANRWLRCTLEPALPAVITAGSTNGVFAGTRIGDAGFMDVQLYYEGYGYLEANREASEYTHFVLATFA
jgi:hypothetical protein